MAPVYSRVVARFAIGAVEGTGGGGGGGPSGSSGARTAGGIGSPVVEGPALAVFVGEGGGGGRRWYTVP
jgi:hypothetical protein